MDNLIKMLNSENESDVKLAVIIYYKKFGFYKLYKWVRKNYKHDLSPVIESNEGVIFTSMSGIVFTKGPNYNKFEGRFTINLVHELYEAP